MEAVLAALMTALIETDSKRRIKIGEANKEKIEMEGKKTREM